MDKEKLLKLLKICEMENDVSEVEEVKPYGTKIPVVGFKYGSIRWYHVFRDDSGKIVVLEDQRDEEYRGINYECAFLAIALNLAEKVLEKKI